jgi:hypothetical protein
MSLLKNFIAKTTMALKWITTVDVSSLHTLIMQVKDDEVEGEENYIVMH